MYICYGLGGQNDKCMSCKDKILVSWPNGLGWQCVKICLCLFDSLRTRKAKCEAESLNEIQKTFCLSFGALPFIITLLGCFLSPPCHNVSSSWSLSISFNVRRLRLFASYLLCANPHKPLLYFLLSHRWHLYLHYGDFDRTFAFRIWYALQLVKV